MESTRIDWVREHCRLLRTISAEFSRTRPFDGMTIGTGVKSALDASVFSAAAGAFGLALLGPDPWSVDGLRVTSDRSGVAACSGLARRRR